MVKPLTSLSKGRLLVNLSWHVKIILNTHIATKYMVVNEHFGLLIAHG